MHQLRHKRIRRDIELFDEHGTSVTYQIQHEDNPNDTCNDFYPIKYKRGNEEKILRLQNDSEDLTVSSMLDEFPIISVQRASDCFRMGKPNQIDPPTHPILSIVQPIPLARPKMTQSTQRALATTHTTSVQTLKMTILYVTSVFKLTKPDSVKSNELTT